MTREELDAALRTLNFAELNLPRFRAVILDHDAAQRQTIKRLEGRVQALEGALKGMLRFKTLVGYDEYRKAQAALAATGEIGTLNQYLEQINRSSPERSEG